MKYVYTVCMTKEVEIIYFQDLEIFNALHKNIIVIT